MNARGRARMGPAGARAITEASAAVAARTIATVTPAAGRFQPAEAASAGVAA